jgi:hypothetical protein
VRSGSISIRRHLAEVEDLRQLAKSDSETYVALREVKAFQALRFRGTYSDLISGSQFRNATQFFLSELYGEKDFSSRDHEFFKIAGALEKYFPASVVQTASSLAALHALSERLDFQMAQAWLSHSIHADSALRYAYSWKHVSTLGERQQQLRAVIDIGLELDRLTRIPALRLALRMMRMPAKRAGLSSLQAFLESGFDTFAEMAKNGRLAHRFLDIIQARERNWIDALFNDQAQVAANKLIVCLNKP